jgi:TPR repeat protein
MATLAGMYEQGLGVEKNAARAKALYAAAGFGDGSAPD